MILDAIMLRAASLGIGLRQSGNGAPEYGGAWRRFMSLPKKRFGGKNYYMESNTPIFDRTPDHVKALREAPYREIARIALADGRFDFANAALREGEAAGTAAGLEYVAELPISISSLSEEAPKDKVKTSLVDPETMKKVEGLVVNQTDLLAYAQSRQPEPLTNRAKAFPRQVWGHLITLKNANRREDYGGARYHKAPPLRQVPLKFVREIPELGNSRKPFSDRLADLDLGSLIEFLAVYAKYKSQYPQLTTAGILGNGFGPAKVEFLNEFVSYKLDELDHPTEAT